MPLYDNECTQCGRQFELLQRFSEVPSACPSCGNADTTRLLSVNTAPVHKAGKPYDALDRHQQAPSKPIKAFANDRRKGGRDTS